jgi:cobaltochelatase CobN
MQEHGYKGAGDLAATVDVALGWDATTGVVSDRLWADLAETYAFDEARQEWFEAVNPWALGHVADTLLEAIERGLWDADAATADRLRDLELRVDGELETRAGAGADDAALGEVSSGDD